MKSLVTLIVVSLLPWGCGCDRDRGPTCPRPRPGAPAVRTIYTGRATSDNHLVEIPEITSDLPSVSVYADIIGPPPTLKVQLPIALGDPPELYWFVVDEDYHWVTIKNCKNAHFTIVIVQ